MTSIVLLLADSAEAASSGGLPQLDYASWPNQIVWLVITFAVLYFTLSTIILPSLGKTISNRQDHIADDLDTAARLQREAEQAEISYERALTDARAKAHNIAESTRKSVDAEITEEIEKAEAEFAKEQASAETRINKMRTQALNNVEAIASDTARDILSKLTGKAPTLAQIKALIAKG